MLIRFVIWLRRLAGILTIGVGFGITTLNLTPAISVLGLVLVLSPYLQGKLGLGVRMVLSIAAVAISIHLLSAGEVVFAAISIVTAINLRVIDMDIVTEDLFLQKLQDIQARAR
jgi:hypothetical protein